VIDLVATAMRESLAKWELRSRITNPAVGSAEERPVKELKAFTRTAVQAGETNTVQFELPISRLVYYDEA